MSPSRHRTALLSNVRHQTAASGGLHTFEPSSAHRTSAVQERLGNQPHCVYGSPSLSPKSRCASNTNIMWVRLKASMAGPC
eukprot:1044091-Pelagomonas_calceolata.AAC.8